MQITKVSRLHVLSSNWKRNFCQNKKGFAAIFWFLSKKTRLTFHQIDPLGQFGLLVAMSVHIRPTLFVYLNLVPFPCNFFFKALYWPLDCGRINQAAARWQDQPKPFIYEARESSLVPEGFLTAQLLQKL